MCSNPALIAVGRVKECEREAGACRCVHSAACSLLLCDVDNIMDDDTILILYIRGVPLNDEASRANH